MDLSKIIDAQFQVERHNVLKTSPQLMLGELILLLGVIDDKSLSVRYEDSGWPLAIGSWRGIYAELALDHSTKEHPMTVSQLLVVLKSAIGKPFTGYKGGEFVMGKNTPIWRDNYGTSTDTAIVGVRVADNCVILETANLEPYPNS